MGEFEDAIKVWESYDLGWRRYWAIRVAEGVKREDVYIEHQIKRHKKYHSWWRWLF